LAAVDSGRKNCCGIYRIGDVQHGSRPAPSRRGIVSGLRPTCNRSRRVVWRMLTWISYRTPLGSRRNDLIERHSSRRSRANWVPFAAAVFLRRRPRSHHLTQRISCRSHPRSLLTRWWREMDSNRRYRATGPELREGLISLLLDRGQRKIRREWEPAPRPTAPPRRRRTGCRPRPHSAL
jgi:hypothetical protein